MIDTKNRSRLVKTWSSMVQTRSSMVQTRSSTVQTRSSTVQTRIKWLSTGQVHIQTVKYGSDYSRVLSIKSQTNLDWSSKNQYSRVQI